MQRNKNLQYDADAQTPKAGAISHADAGLNHETPTPTPVTGTRETSPKSRFTISAIMDAIRMAVAGPPTNIPPSVQIPIQETPPHRPRTVTIDQIVMPREVKITYSIESIIHKFPIDTAVQIKREEYAIFTKGTVVDIYQDGTLVVAVNDLEGNKTSVKRIPPKLISQYIKTSLPTPNVPKAPDKSYLPGQPLYFYHDEDRLDALDRMEGLEIIKHTPSHSYYLLNTNLTNQSGDTITTWRHNNGLQINHQLQQIMGVATVQEPRIRPLYLREIINHFSFTIEQNPADKYYYLMIENCETGSKEVIALGTKDKMIAYLTWNSIKSKLWNLASNSRISGEFTSDVQELALTSSRRHSSPDLRLELETTYYQESTRAETTPDHPGLSSFLDDTVATVVPPEIDKKS